MDPLILASRSPRRSRILRWAHVPYHIVAPLGVEEGRHSGEAPYRMVRRLALEKAMEVGGRFPKAWVLGADTTVVLGKHVLEKPVDRKDARRMLLSLQGKEHQVLTGVAFLRKGKKPSAWVERTLVRFGRIPPKGLESYLDSRTPYDKAGGYDIQGRAGDWIEGIQGDFFNVMGLPLGRVLELFEREGLLPRRDRSTLG